MSVNRVLFKNDRKAYHGHVDSILFLKLKGITLVNQHHSCESTLIGLEKDWKRPKDNQLISVSILSTDMSKVFVCIDHMFCKLKALMVSEKRWSTSFGVTCTIANVVYDSGQ